MLDNRPIFGTTTIYLIQQPIVDTGTYTCLPECVWNGFHMQFHCKLIKQQWKRQTKYKGWRLQYWVWAAVYATDDA